MKKNKLYTNDGISVLSLFDGMGCGRLALDRAGIPVANYFASEVDKFVIKVTTAKWPGIVHLGDVVMLRRALCWGYKTRKRFYSSPYIPEATKTAFKEINNIFRYVKIDLLIGGSPCQGFSFAGKRLNFNDPRSRLFFEFVKIKDRLLQLNPNLVFLLENVVMEKPHQTIISKFMGLPPVQLNSSLVSAQNRVRLYWCNINMVPAGLFGDVLPHIPPPKDKGIVLKHILQQGVAAKYYLSDKAIARLLKKENLDVSEKDFSLTASYSKGVSERNAHTIVKVDFDGVTNNNGQLKQIDKSTCIDANVHKGMDNHAQRTMVVESEHHTIVSMRGRYLVDGKRHDVAGAPTTQRLEEKTDGKTNNLSTVQKDNLVHTKKIIQVNPAKEFGNMPQQQNRVYSDEGLSATLRVADNQGPKILTNQTIRRLTPIECCRLQTVPDDYFFDATGQPLVSETQMYKMLGNGWTVDMIVHILTQ